MSTFEKIIAAFRRSAKVMMNNLWLFAFGIVYTLAGPILCLGGTGVPVLLWVLSGREFQPELLWSDPLSFLVGHWQLVLFAMVGFFIGFTIYLVLIIFYYGAITGSVAQAAPAGGTGSLNLPFTVFLREGRRNFGSSLGTATIASLLPLFPAVPLLVLALLLAARLPSIVAGGDFQATPLLVLAGVGFAFFLLLTVVLSWLAFLWYSLGLCAVCVELLPSGAAMKRALKFFTENWPMVLGLVVVSILLTLAGWMLTAPWGFLAELVKEVSPVMALLLRLIIFPVSMVISVFLEIWVKAALVVLFVDNR